MGVPWRGTEAGVPAAGSAPEVDQEIGAGGGGDMHLARRTQHLDAAGDAGAELGGRFRAFEDFGMFVADDEQARIAGLFDLRPFRRMDRPRRCNRR